MIAIQLSPQTLSRRTPIKFTPVTLRQITNLVERGKTPEEIAEIIGLTPDALQVACSKLGITLRRRIFDVGTRMRSGPYTKAGRRQGNSYRGTTVLEPVERQQPRSVAIGEAKAGIPSQGARPGGLADPASVVLAIRMNYKDEERTIALPLDQAVVEQLVLQAEIRGMRIGELVMAMMKKDLCPSLIGD